MNEKVLTPMGVKSNGDISPYTFLVAGIVCGVIGAVAASDNGAVGIAFAIISAGLLVATPIWFIVHAVNAYVANALKDAEDGDHRPNASKD